MKYGHAKQTDLSFQDAVNRTKEELAKEGFGILTEIDVSATLKKKLDVDYGHYVILGACNPPLALRAAPCRKRDRPALTLQRDRIRG